MHKLTFSSIVLLLVASSVLQAAELTEGWTSAAELQAPESVIYDQKRDVLYVSNINGGPMDDDQNGFISKLSTDGAVLELRLFENGLSAPKGMAIVNDHLFIADINRVVEIDLTNGETINVFQAQGATFLNDITSDAEGNLYISDMMATTVYQIKDGNISLWIDDKQLASPNGLAVLGDELIVGTWGVIDGEGFATSVPGHLYGISLRDKSVRDWGTSDSVGNIDGLEYTAEGHALVSDWYAGRIKLVTATGEQAELIDLPQGSADFDYVAETNTIYIPMMLEGTVKSFVLTP